MQTRYGAVAAPPLRGVTPDAHKPGPTSHLEMRERGLVQCVAGPSDVISGTDFQGALFPGRGASAGPYFDGECFWTRPGPQGRPYPRERPCGEITCGFPARPNFVLMVMAGG